MTVAQLIEKLQTMNPTAIVTAERIFDNEVARDKLSPSQYWGVTLKVDVMPDVNNTHVLITID